uniref:Polycystin cation channel PKD1/PKD2 domain-containing protein n=1 Tax=Pyrodinium bahamense TaxID=73915 RepID=A0A7S0AK24_9DINO
MLGYGLIGRALFGHKFHHFDSLGNTLQTEYLMCLGELPSYFGSDWRFTIFCLLFQVSLYFLIVNFLLAILTETFSNVKSQLEYSEVEQEFFTDLFSIFHMKALRRSQAWPPHEAVIKGLEGIYGFTYVDIDRLMLAVPGLDRKSCINLLRHYRSFVALQYTFTHVDHQGATTERKMAKLLEDSKHNRKAIVEIQKALNVGTWSIKSATL